MKKTILLIYLLIFSYTLQGQEKTSYKFKNQDIDFKISQEEIYIEFTTDSKAIIIQNSKNNYEEVTKNSAILRIKELKGTFQNRKDNLKSNISTKFKRIEPVLVYKDGTRQIVNGEINIKLKPNIALKDVLKEQNFTFKINEFDKNLYLVSSDIETSDLFKLITNLQNDIRIEFIEPNFTRIIKPNTNDPFFSSQWSINNQGYLGGLINADMNVDNAWAYATGTGIKVAIIDEGVDLTHPDLTANLLGGYDATGSGSNGAPNETNNDGHGTSCAGIVAAIGNNNNGVIGIAYNSKIMPVRIASSNGQPLGNPNRAWITNDTWIANGINWAWQNGADVLSNSWGGGSPSNTITNAITNAVNNGRNGKGSVVLFSSGNNNTSVSFPANLENVISVGASSMCDQRKSPTSCDGETWWGSNFGTQLDIVAPGVKIYTTDISGAAGYSIGDYKSDFNGTSSACPNAAGVVALILSANPNLTQLQARSVLERNADKVSGYNYSNNSSQPNGTWNNEVGYGRINALKAVEEVVLGNVALSGSNTICNSNTSITLSGLPSGISASWSVSSNLQIVSSSSSGAVVKAINSTIQGSGFIRATIGSRIITKNIWVGLPSAVTSLSHVSTFGCTMGEINAFSGGGADQYEWNISGGKIVIPNVNSNTYTGQGVVFVDPIDGPYGFTVKVRAKNNCGYSAWYTKNIPTNCSIGGGGGVTPLDSSFIIDDKAMLFPNPSNDKVFVNLSILSNNEDNSTFQITIYDIDGRLIYDNKTKQALEQINTSEFNNGIYLLHLSNGEKTISEKLVIKH